MVLSVTKYLIQRPKPSTELPTAKRPPGRLAELGREGEFFSSLLVLGLKDRPSSPNEAISQLLVIHQDLVDQGASPIAITLSGIAVESATANGPIAYADVEGAIGGAILGVELGGPWGAVIGGVIGGAAASIALAL